MPGFVIYLPALAIPVLLLSMYSTIVFEQIVVGLCAMFLSILCFTLRVLVAQRNVERKAIAWCSSCLGGSICICIRPAHA